MMIQVSKLIWRLIIFELKYKELKAAMKAFLLPGTGAHEVGFLRSKILVETVGNKPWINLVKKATGLMVFPISYQQ